MPENEPAPIGSGKEFDGMRKREREREILPASLLVISALRVLGEAKEIFTFCGCRLATAQQFDQIVSRPLFSFSLGEGCPHGIRKTSFRDSWRICLSVFHSFPGDVVESGAMDLWGLSTGLPTTDMNIVVMKVSS